MREVDCDGKWVENWLFNSIRQAMVFLHDEKDVKHCLYPDLMRLCLQAEHISKEIDTIMERVSTGCEPTRDGEVDKNG